MAAGKSRPLFSSIFVLMTKCQKTASAIILLGLVFLLACRFSQAVADFYALDLYPGISAALSFVASATAFSLTEITALLLILAVLLILGLALAKRMKWKRALWDTVLILAGAMVWLYLGWGSNYFRSSLYQRRDIEPAIFRKEVLKEFLSWYSLQLEGNLPESTSVNLSKGDVEEEIRQYYMENASWGKLCQPRAYQHPKRLLLENLYAGVGVLGFIGPFFTEHHVSGKLLDMEYPYTLAHEYAHVLGVSEEAEANYWAFRACMSSSSSQMRYSALQGILSQVISSAQSMLDEKEYSSWIETVPPRALEDLKKRQEHWRGLYWPVIGKIQEDVYDLFLRGNRVSGGTANYGRVVGMILTFDRYGLP